MHDRYARLNQWSFVEDEKSNLELWPRQAHWNQLEMARVDEKSPYDCNLEHGVQLRLCHVDRASCQLSATFILNLWESQGSFQEKVYRHWWECKNKRTHRWHLEQSNNFEHRRYWPNELQSLWVRPSCSGWQLLDQRKLLSSKSYRLHGRVRSSDL